MKCTHLLLILSVLNLYSAKAELEPTDWTQLPIIKTAAYPGDSGVKAMQELLQKGADPNTRASNGVSPLMIAANFGNAEMVRLLLEWGADANATTADYHTNALHSLACAEIMHTTDEKEAARNLLEIAEMLIAAGTNINQENIEGITPLLVAAGRNSILTEVFLKAGAALPQSGTAQLENQIDYLIREGAVEHMLQHGLNPNLQTPQHLSILQIAVAHRAAGVVRALVKAGADVNYEGNGVSVLWYAHRYKKEKLSTKRAKIATILLDAGADSSRLYGTTDSKSTVWHACASCGDNHILTLLIQRRKDLVNIRDTNNRTPLHDAAAYGTLDTVKTLISAGADLNAINKDAGASTYGGFNVAACATSSNKQALDKLKAILEAGAAFDEAAQKNIMLSAAQFGNVDVMRYLLNRGVDANMRTAHDIPLVQTAVNNPDTGVLEALLSAGADANAVNSAGLSPLHWAVQKALNDHSKRIITLLLNAGGKLLQKDNYGRTPWDCASPEIKEWLRRR